MSVLFRLKAEPLNTLKFNVYFAAGFWLYVLSSDNIKTALLSIHSHLLKTVLDRNKFVLFLFIVKGVASLCLLVNVLKFDADASEVQKVFRTAKEKKFHHGIWFFFHKLDAHTHICFNCLAKSHFLKYINLFLISTISKGYSKVALSTFSDIQLPCQKGKIFSKGSRHICHANTEDISSLRFLKWCWMSKLGK